MPRKKNYLKAGRNGPTTNVIRAIQYVPYGALLYVLGISDTPARELLAKGVLKESKPETYDLAENVQAYIAFTQQGRKQQQAASVRTSLYDQQVRKIKLENDRREAKVVETADVEEVFNETMTTVVTTLEGLPGRLAGELALMTEPAFIRKRLQDEIRIIRRAAAQNLASVAGVEIRD